MTKFLTPLTAIALAAALQMGASGLALAQTTPSPTGEPAANGSPPPQQPEGPLAGTEAQGPEEFLPVLYVTSVEIIRTASKPQQDIVWVRGLTGTIGWSQPELAPLFQGLAADGILDLQLIAQVPVTSQQAEGFVPIAASFPIEPGITFKGVRVRGAANVVEVKSMPGIAEAKITAEDCGACVGKRFAPKGTAAAGTPDVVREEDLPRNFRIIPPNKGVAGLTHNMNRLNLVLGDDDKTIVWAFWE